MVAVGTQRNLLWTLLLVPLAACHARSQVAIGTTSARSDFATNAKAGAAVAAMPEWYASESPCHGDRLVGAAPPDGTAIMCMRGKQRHGAFSSWYDDSRPKSHGHYTRGQATGSWLLWSASGQLLGEFNCRDGTTYDQDPGKGPLPRVIGCRDSNAQLHGDYLEVNDNDEPKLQGTYEHGQQTDAWTVWTEDGEQVGPYVCPERTSMRVNARYDIDVECLKAGRRHGPFVKRQRGGVGMTGEYRNGTAVGEWTFYFGDSKSLGPIGCPEGTTWERDPVYNRELKCVKADGSAAGDYLSWSWSGVVIERGQYLSGEKDGTWLRSFESGGTQSESQYIAGKQTGTWREWYDNGTLASEETYVDGVRDGVSSSWHSNGTPSQRSTYEKGVLGGTDERWYENGQRQYLRHFKIGQRDGDWQEFYDNGSPKLMASYVSSKAEGSWELFYSDGRQWLRGTYSQGARHGPWKYSDPTGTQSVNIVYNNDKVSALEWSIDGQTKICSSAETADVAWTFDQGLSKLSCLVNGAALLTSIEFHSAGYVVGYGQLQHQKKHGHWTTWHANGKKESEGRYDSGEFRGIWTHWHDNGAKAKSISFAVNGSVMKSSFWGPDGNALGSISCPSGSILDGEPVTQPGVRCRRGRLNHGPSRTWWPNGTLRAQGSYSAGERTGQWTFWNDDGSKVGTYRCPPGFSLTGDPTESYGEVQCANGERALHGIFERRRNSVLLERGMYSFGLRNGLWTVWNDAGKRTSEGPYKDDKKHGVWRAWNDNQELRIEEMFERGEKISLTILSTTSKRSFRCSAGASDTSDSSNGMSCSRNGKRHGPSVFFDRGTGIITEIANYLDGKRDGAWSDFYSNGMRRSEGRFVNGDREGLWTSWRDDGGIRDKTSYAKGRNHGESREWWPNGQLRHSKHFDSGKPASEWTYWTAAGKKIFTASFTANGQWSDGNGTSTCPGGSQLTLWESDLIVAECRVMKDGKETLDSDGEPLQTGPYAAYFENGLVERYGHLMSGKSDGQWNFWYESGQKKRVWNWINGKLHGSDEGFYESGKPHWRAFHQNGEPEGEILEWHENGVLRLEGHYAAGARVGTWTLRDSGNVDLAVVVYDRGGIRFARWTSHGKPQTCGDGNPSRAQWDNENGLKLWCIDPAGKRHGPSASWNESSQLLSAGSYLHGKKHGSWTTWNDRTQGFDKKRFVNGQIRQPSQPKRKKF